MHASSTVTRIVLTILPLLSQTSAWLVEFWDTQPNCGDNGGAADTERGGLPYQENCSLLGLEDVQAMLISDWDDGCKVSLFDGSPSSALCMGEPVWEKYKEEVAEDGNLADNNYSCQVNIEGRGVTYVSYKCGE
ncbi:hypothetical protein DL764_004630 [Monosporascus ibericus]|uniref:Ecp2 effector protein domain-containing protein n=1 Tax=Monosporascus ibericus TaxID=155417 RepID=A0A4Q4TFV1_9PEZI|nr:hypothetical protein DL764_004630 [Monosporascus ibericus]